MNRAFIVNKSLTCVIMRMNEKIILLLRVCLTDDVPVVASSSAGNDYG
jgi:hypothetical protein